MGTRYRSPDVVSLRPARVGDIDTMASIEVDSFSDPWPASAFADLLQARHARVTVAVDEQDVPVGYCVLLAMADEGEIANIAVRSGLRGRGVGARLLDQALDAAQHEGVHSVYLEVRTSNHAARDLYASRAFVAVGRRRAYYRNPLEDALVLRWDRPASS
jgi:ribosomal-protein-alanine N-acetyltransferase